MLEHPLQQQAVTTALRGRAQPLVEPFVFVPVAGDEAAKGRGAAKRIVRAHVTRVQHAKSSALSGTQDLQTWTVRPYIHRDTLAVRKKAQNGCTAAKTKKRPQRRTHSSSEESTESEGSRGEQQSVAVVLHRLPSGGGHEDPFWTYPVEHKPELSPLFAHYIMNIAVEIPDIDGPGAKGLLRKNWFPLMMTEPAPM